MQTFQLIKRMNRITELFNKIQDKISSLSRQHTEYRYHSGRGRIDGTSTLYMWNHIQADLRKNPYYLKLVKLSDRLNDAGIEVRKRLGLYSYDPCSCAICDECGEYQDAVRNVKAYARCQSCGALLKEKPIKKCLNNCKFNKYSIIENPKMKICKEAKVEDKILDENELYNKVKRIF